MTDKIINALQVPAFVHCTCSEHAASFLASGNGSAFFFSLSFGIKNEYFCKLLSVHPLTSNVKFRMKTASCLRYLKLVFYAVKNFIAVRLQKPSSVFSSPLLRCKFVLIVCASTRSTSEHYVQLP